MKRSSKSSAPKLVRRRVVDLSLEAFESRYYPGELLTTIGWSFLGSGLSFLFRQDLATHFQPRLPHEDLAPLALMAPTVAPKGVTDSRRLALVSAAISGGIANPDEPGDDSASSCQMGQASGPAL